jgi:ligand-binding SRPBCC domain-containing protein
MSSARTGCPGVGDTVTLSGRHFGLRFSHTSMMDACRPPMYFRDVMVAGVFEHFEHEHHFAVMNDGTRIRDEVRFSAALGPLGRVAEKMLLRGHLIRLLQQRNAVLKRVAESGEWHRYLDETTEVERVGGRLAGEWERSAVVRG